MVRSSAICRGLRDRVKAFTLPPHGQAHLLALSIPQASFLPVSRNLAPPRTSHCARGVSFWRFNVIMLEDITEVTMPKVGSKHYAYTPKGMAKAKAAAKKSGKKVSYAKKKK